MNKDLPYVELTDYVTIIRFGIYILSIIPRALLLVSLTRSKYRAATHRYSYRVIQEVLLLLGSLLFFLD